MDESGILDEPARMIAAKAPIDAVDPRD